MATIRDQSLSVTRSLWPWGFRADGKAVLAVSAQESKEFLTQLLTNLLPREALSGEPMHDMTGIEGEGEEPILTGVPAPKQGEVFSAHGKVALPPSEQTEDGETESDFGVELITRFENFDPPALINFRVDPRIYGVELSGFQLRELALTSGITVETYRVALSVFQNRFTSLVGASPAVSQRVVIEATQAQIAIVFSREGMKHRSDPPLGLANVGAKLSNCTKTALGGVILSSLAG